MNFPLLLAAVVAIGLSAPALAQRTGSLIGRQAKAGTADAAEYAEGFAKCMAGRQAKTVRAWMLSLPGSYEENEILAKLKPDFAACMDNDKLVLEDGGGMRFTQAGMRQRVGYALARRLLDTAPATSPVAENMQYWFMPKVQALGPGQPADRTALAMHEVTSCVSRKKWPESLALLRSKSGSPEERDVMQQLVPVLPTCLPQGVKLSITRERLRLYMGEAVYHAISDEHLPVTASASSR
ncbi:hypothetical protein ACFOMD_15165 [Sphingoaurantiacus capsulatus]|uniref:Uncharacterized protein n=1 Tax=Sphingoaurantiacus capsulatus TaxID=1771310 RepID=A0ABV7XEN0_9SPHN